MSFVKKNPATLFGLGLMALFLWLGFARLDFIDGLELKLYDMRMKLTQQPEAASDIVLVDIDDDSIEKLGRWPWPRSLVAKAIDKLHAAGPKLIGLNILFSEVEENSGLKVLGQLEELFKKSGLDKSGEGAADFLKEMGALKVQMDNDTALAIALEQAKDVILPVIFVPTLAVDETQAAEMDLAQRAITAVKSAPDATCPKAGQVLLPLPSLLKAAKGLGHISLGPDLDGKARRDRLVYSYRGVYVPSYALTLAALSLNVPVDKIEIVLGASARVGQTEIPLTLESEFLVSFKGPRGAFKRFSCFDVLNDKIPSGVFKNKLVLVGVSASGLVNPLSTPSDSLMPLSEYSANTVWSILNKRFIQKPAWNMGAELLAVLVVGLLIAFVFPRLRALPAGLVFLGLVSAMLGGATYLFVAKGLWISTTYPLLLCLLGYLGVISLKYLVTEADKDKVEGESAESNRMLGLSFQEQGRLDMAFEKFKRVPVDENMKDTLYNLALDFERKRQYHKAVAVYEHIEKRDPKFKDIRERKSKMIQVGETVVLGSSAPDPLLSTATDTRPTLGRYEIVKQLGKGAMGVVYLGKDPRINRTTAIKTFQFPDDFEPDELKALKQRFFQEAESAGTLTHPNIVTIYDAGEEKDLAYIAMEFLEGHDLQRYTKKGQLLPIPTLLPYIADLADALDYAHQKGIVHRDIKPANVMLLDAGPMKITDFGIARITASSQTQTGVVKGTPHYMSPEQISGQKVDGRSDIFSLGVMFYQLLTGETPFRGDNLAALMHQIMNVSHPDPRTVDPDIPSPLVKILGKALEKDREKRYQRASSMASDLRKVVEVLTHRDK
jgi:serine/threonine-protein kinase